MIDVSFDGRKAYSFGLILTSQNIPLPEPKTYTVEVPGADGSLDLSTALTDGEVKFKNRELTLKFSALGTRATFEAKKKEFASWVHGKVIKIILDDAPNVYFFGRCSITDVDTSEFPATITVTVDAEPFRYSVVDFSISRTVIGNAMVDISSDGWDMSSVPTITVDSQLTVTFNDREFTLLPGDNIIPEIRIPGNSEISLLFTGDADVEIKWKGGCL